MVIIGVLLAAGQSKRMGKDKLTLPFRGKTLGATSLHNFLASRLQEIRIVTRPDDPMDWMDPSCYISPNRAKWSQVPCRQADHGMAYSIRCGVLAAQQAGAEALMIGLADQPFVTPWHINRLYEMFEQNCEEQENVQFVCYQNRSNVYPPVLFAASLFPELLMLEGDEGAGKLIRSGRWKGLRITEEETDWYMDFDTREVYQSYLSCGSQDKSQGE
jgi:molybdenum cofactor cytidylyltransferase